MNYNNITPGNMAHLDRVLQAIKKPSFRNLPEDLQEVLGLTIGSYNTAKNEGVGIYHLRDHPISRQIVCLAIAQYEVANKVSI